MTFLPIIQTVYWLSLATWFGMVVFVAVAAPVVFRTVRDANPILPTVLSVNLENQHGSLLAGSIVGNILRALSHWQIGCAVAFLLAFVAQGFAMQGLGVDRLNVMLRGALFLACTGLMAYDRWGLGPRVWRLRQEFIDHADEPDLANPAKEQFDRLHMDSARLLTLQLALLSLIIVLSSMVGVGLRVL